MLENNVALFENGDLEEVFELVKAVFVPVGVNTARMNYFRNGQQFYFVKNHKILLKHPKMVLVAVRIVRLLYHNISVLYIPVFAVMSFLYMKIRIIYLFIGRQAL